MKEAIEQLGGHKLKGLVLDLRNNPGGVLTSAAGDGGAVPEARAKDLSVRGRSVQGARVEVPENATPYSFPSAVLVNGKSASASEIVAGALQDHKRAVSSASRATAKGLVQSVLPLSQGTGIGADHGVLLHTRGPFDSAQTYQGSSRRPQRDASGGITPDQIVHPESVTRLRAVLDATGAFPTFAQSTFSETRHVTARFRGIESLLDEFQVFLSARNIRPGLGGMVEGARLDSQPPEAGNLQSGARGRKRR